MRSFHLILLDLEATEPRRIDFVAESPDHAFQVARNETDGIHVELWEGSVLLARMAKAGANIWKLLPSGHGAGGQTAPPVHFPLRKQCTARAASSFPPDLSRPGTNRAYLTET